MAVLGVLMGAAGWAVAIGRRQREHLHVLQLEGYQTGRFLRWTLQRRERWAGRVDVAAALASVVPGLWDVLARRRLTSTWPMLAVWGALPSMLGKRGPTGPATKPLVLTSRAKRLVAGQAATGALVALGPAALLALRGGAARQRAVPALWIGLGAAYVGSPILTAAANLLLWPVEEAFRRYYLADAKRALRRHRPTAVAVAGSYGKTSTKEFTAAILSARWSVLRPPGSYNTPMGLSRVIREQLQPSHEIFVAELGDYVPGDIRFLCDLVGPRIGILTTIGPEHLERFKTMDRIVQSKAELIDALPADGVAIVNQDDPAVRALGDRAASRGVRVIRYGQSVAGADVRARDVRTTRDGIAFVVEAEGQGEAQFQIGVLGRHNVMNALAAACAGLALGMTLPEIAQAARTIEPVQHRLQPIRGAGGVLVIDDTYNSNPRGAAEALAVLGEIEGGKKIMVTPGMIELAEREVEEHRALGRRAATVCDAVILVGPERTIPIAEGLREAGFPAEALHTVRSRDEATARLSGLLRTGDVVLWENDLPDTYAEPGSGVSGRNPAATETGAAPDLTSGAPARAVRDDGPDPTGTRSVDVDGLRIAYREDGPPGGPPVLVLHGWGASKEAVASIQAALRVTHRTIAPDLPGFGRSTQPAMPWGSAEYAALVASFARALGVGRTSFIGHSFGGKISAVLAATRPALVDRLVLVDSAGIRPRRGPGYRARVYAFKAGRRAVGSPLLAGPLGAPVRHWFDSRFGSADYRQAGSMRATLVRVVNEDIRGLLPRIGAPTLLIWGELDDDTPVSDGQLMERTIPDAGLVVFPGAGHYAYADDLDRFARIVGHFLAPGS